MANESLFFTTRVECPICKTVNDYESVRVGAYYENGRDTDFCPTGIKWRNDKYEGYNPLIYFTATCSNCYYSREFSTNFKEWKDDNTFRNYRLKTVKERHLDQLATADSVVRTLGEAINVSRYPNETAIVKLHLAIFDELLNDHPSSLDLGRFYLRVGWVYRDLDKDEVPRVSSLRGMLLDLSDGLAGVRERLGATEESRTEFQTTLSDHFANTSLPAEIQAIMVRYRDQFNSGMQQIDQSFGVVVQQLTVMAELLNEYQAQVAGETATAEASYGNYPSFTDFLIDLKARWPHVVLGEREALEKAIFYYKEAFSGGREISPGNQQIQASYLIAELSRRIGDYDGAREFFNSTIKTGQAFVYENRNDPSRTALARKILELAIEQGRSNMKALKSA